MNTYKNIEKLGLTPIIIDGFPALVSADNLELILQSAQVVYEVENSAGINSWLHIDAIGAKSKALLIGITPIKKKTKAEAALELLQEMVDDKNCDMAGTEHNFYIEAKKILEMKDEV